MEIYEIYGKGKLKNYEPGIFIVSGWKGKEDIYTYSKSLGIMVKRTKTDMDYKHFKKHLQNMKNEGFIVHKVTKNFETDILI